MKFCLHKIILWSLKTHVIRTIDFMPNKINIITGKEDTGKSAILKIIAYCFLSQKVNDIPQEIINENVAWYGLSFTINGNNYTIARERPADNGFPSSVLYFSQIGEIPQKPYHNSKRSEINYFLNKEFNVKFINFDFEGEKSELIKNISFQTLLFFNILSSNILTHETDFFDFGFLKQSTTDKNKKSKEYFDIAFDLVIGAEDPSLVVLRKRIEKLEKEKKRFESKRQEFEKVLYTISKDAKNFGIIDENVTGFENNYEAVSSLMRKFNNDKLSTDLSQFEQLKTEELILTRQIRNLKRYQKEFEKYNELQSKEIDSLKPIDFLYENFHEIIDTPIVHEFIENLELEFKSIKKQLQENPPEVPNVENRIAELNNQLAQIQLELEQFPIFNWNFETEVGKYIHIGRLKERFYENEKYKAKEKFDIELNRINQEIEDLSTFVKYQHIDKEQTKLDIENSIQKYIDNSNVLEEYKEYKVRFDLQEKSINLSKKYQFYKGGIGSSSNYLFLHLAFFLGLHEYFIEPREIETPSILPLLIIDQFSNPFEKDVSITKEQQDTKFKKAMNLLNGFIKYLNSSLKDEFQIIILDNSRPQMIRDWNMENIHFVEDFRNGNALITNEMINLHNIQ